MHRKLIDIFRVNHFDKWTVPKNVTRLRILMNIRRIMLSVDCSIKMYNRYRLVFILPFAHVPRTLELKCQSCSNNKNYELTIKLKRFSDTNVTLEILTKKNKRLYLYVIYNFFSLFRSDFKYLKLKYLLHYLSHVGAINNIYDSFMIFSSFCLFSFFENRNICSFHIIEIIIIKLIV